MSRAPRCYMETTPLRFNVAFDPADSFYELQGSFDTLL